MQTKPYMAASMTTNLENNHAQMENYVLGQALMAVSDALLIANLDEDDYPVTYVNNHILEILGVSSIEVLGKPALEILSSIVPDTEVDILFEKALSDKTSLNFEAENGEGDSRVWYDFNMQVNEKFGDMPKLLTCIINDVTQQKHQQMQLIQSQKLEALGQLAGGVAHDFNNLMSIIDGYARIALQEVGPDSKLAEALHKIMASVERGAGLTDQLLTYGRHNIIVENVIDIGATIEEQKSLLYPLVSESVEIHFETVEDLNVDCSVNHLNQILVNMCVNARDAMPRGGRLHLSTLPVAWQDIPQELNLPESAYICLSISDTGMGMSNDIKDKIFDPFFTTKPSGEGSGLGLSIVYGLVKQMNGAIDVESQMGQGTTFSIYLPLSEKRPAKKIILTDESSENIRFEGFTTLVVEDEDDLRAVIVNILSQTGMNVIQAANGNEALTLQDDYNSDIDFLLTDVVMPKLNGVRLAYLFESLRPDTKTLFMSGYPANTDSAKIELPDNSYLISKPIEYSRLIKALAELSGKAQEQTSDAIGRMAGI